ncbi:GNAT family N-acetyltransferase [Staphylococcus simulans]|uniref:GNAT family N-acetyltransferase n=1 Tax=Staphylococcus simulans TaxID=1286 RepID=UPI001E637809|nr:GNAT family N-acetyltransferase [Staphylococcus simulans]MCD8915794.1 GNAT family N-acetyltransferase [Staphylococcus simulans]
MKAIQIDSAQDIQSFIHQADTSMCSYIYKLHQKNVALSQSIDALKHDTGVYALVNDTDEIQMLMGGFSYDTQHFKMVGPFLAPNYQLDAQAFKQLFETLADAQPKGAHFNFSFDVTSDYKSSLMKAIDAHYTFTDYYLSTDHTIETSNEAQRHIIPYHKAFFTHFEPLHHKIFRREAMTASEIVNTIDENNQLFFFVSEGILKGYLYLQIKPDKQSAEIKYFSSHTDYRNEGIAFNLLSYAIHYAFKRDTIKKVYFKIRSKNDRLVDRFSELGFDIRSERKKFKYIKE